MGGGGGRPKEQKSGNEGERSGMDRHKKPPANLSAHDILPGWLRLKLFAAARRDASFRL